MGMGLRHRILEKRYEIMGMLGRRISLNDVISFNLYGNNEQPEKPDKPKQFINFLMKKSSEINISTTWNMQRK